MRSYIFSFLFLVGACGGTTNDTTADSGHSDGSERTDSATPPEGGSRQDASPFDAGDSDVTAPACNTLANTAPLVEYNQVAENPPSPAGGTIADGAYWLTSASIYTGPNGPTGPAGTTQTTVQITGLSVQEVNTGEPTRRTLALTTAGTAFTATDSCPDSDVTQGSYTATPTTLTIFLDGGTDDAGARTVMEVLTKQ